MDRDFQLTREELVAFVTVHGCTPGERAEKMRRKAAKRRKRADGHLSGYDKIMIRFYLDIASIDDRAAGRADWAGCTCDEETATCYGCRVSAGTD